MRNSNVSLKLVNRPLPITRKSRLISSRTTRRSTGAIVGSMTRSYNRVNGEYACGNPDVLKRDLNGRLGFKGFVISNWWVMMGSGIDNGLDMEQPLATVFADNGPAEKAIKAST